MIIATVALASVTVPDVPSFEWMEPVSAIIGRDPAVVATKGRPGEAVKGYMFAAHRPAMWRGVNVEIRYHVDARHRLRNVKLVPASTADCETLGLRATETFGEGKRESGVKEMMPGVLHEQVLSWVKPDYGSHLLYYDIEVPAIHVCHVLIEPVE